MRIFRRYREKANDRHVPFIQPKLQLGKPGDKYEVEADAMADRVVNNTAQGGAVQKMENTEEEVQQKPLAASITPLVQRQPETSEEENVQAKCADCEKEGQLQRQEEEESLQAKSNENEEEIQRQEEEEAVQAKSGLGRRPPSTVASLLRRSKGNGSPMPSKVKNEMESGFGADFSRVNIHTDAQAVQMSKQINAQAFTHGNDIYFNKGKFNPNSASGRHLLAHELTHTIQQKGMLHKKIQMVSYGSGAPPHADYSPVPADEKGRIDRAMAIVKKIVDNPKDYPVCHNFFKSNTPGGTATTLKDIFDRMKVWFDKDDTVFGSSIAPNDLAYTSETWRWGQWSLAGMFIHEMMHLAGQDNEATNDLATKRCRLPDIAEFKDKKK